MRPAVLKLCSQLLFCLGIVGMLGIPVLRQNGASWLVTAGAAGLIGIAFSLAADASRRAKQLRAKTEEEARTRDPRPPVVYLREFWQDNQRDGESMAFGIDSSREQSLVRALAAAGPVIALERPGDRLPPPGAARRKVSGDWKAVVREWIAEAAAVVIVAGRSPNLRWELEQCLSGIEPKRLVIVAAYPDDRAGREAYRAFGEMWTSLSPHPLPELAVGSGLLVFDDGFSPSWLPDRTTAWQRGNRLGNEHVLWQQNLAPFLEKLGIVPTAQSAASPLFKVLFTIVLIILLGGVLLSFLLLRTPSRP
jgi:hypothetical protein